MAIYHLSAKIISRSSGRSATASSAYRAGIAITDNRTGLTHDYTKKKGIDHSEIIAPKSAPNWVQDRAQLWNEVEQAEKRKDAQLCREIEVSLPKELTPEDMKNLVRSFATSEFVERGMIADINLHHIESDNPHAHILLTTREITPEGFGQKNRTWNDKEHLNTWRSNWEKHTNHALERAGSKERIDHRTLEAQGIGRIPQIHLGAKVIEMENRGIKTERGSRALEIEQLNSTLERLHSERELVDYEYSQQIKKSTEHRGISNGDRTPSPVSRELSGRIKTSDDRTNSEPKSTSTRVEHTTSQSSKEMGRSRERVQTSGLEFEFDRTHDPKYDRALDNETLDRHSDSLDNAYSGATARIMALARPSHDDTGRKNMADNETKLDRTYLAVRRQLDGMQCKKYEVGIRDKQGRMMSRHWSREEVLKSVDFLKRENAKGADIYIRPSGEMNQGLILIDDLNQAQLEQMKQTGLAPAVTVETSPHNYQAWLRLSEKPIAPDVATTASRAITKHFGGDMNSADWKHYGRLSGFTNRKPEHTTPNGKNPYVMCHTASGKQANRGDEMIFKAENKIRERNALTERYNRIKHAKNAPERNYKRDPIKEYRKQLKTLSERYGEQIDLSKADYMICLDMAKKGYTEKQLVETLEEASPELALRKAGHEADYCQRTINAVLSSNEFKNSQSQVEPTRSKTEEKHQGFSMGF